MNNEDKVLYSPEGEAFAIEVCGLKKNYGASSALKDVGFSVKKGEIMGFLGPNGAGKSTTMNIITGYISKTSGTVKIFGDDINKNSKAAKKRIGYLPEIPPLYNDLKVYEYLNFVYDLKGTKKNKKEHIKEVMSLAGICDIKNRMIKNLSKGYKQRVGIAQALVGDPEIIVLDEPTVGLDPKQIVEIRNLIKEIGKSRTVILSTHILQEASAVCDRITVINRGRTVVSDSISEIQRKLGEKGRIVIRVLCGEEKCREILSGIEKIKFIGYIGSKEENASDFMLEAEDDVDIRSSLFFAFAAEKIPILELKSSELSLEEIFMRLTEGAAQITDAESGCAAKNPEKEEAEEK